MLNRAEQIALWDTGCSINASHFGKDGVLEHLHASLFFLHIIDRARAILMRIKQALSCCNYKQPLK